MSDADEQQDVMRNACAAIYVIGHLGALLQIPPDEITPKRVEEEIVKRLNLTPCTRR
jgi:hypothetical protein